MSTTETTRTVYLISIRGRVNYKQINEILLLLLNLFLNKSWELSTRIQYRVQVNHETILLYSKQVLRNVY